MSSDRAPAAAPRADQPLGRKLVVAGLIIGSDGRMLITQRRADQALALKWELPGGKIEPGESPVRALRRELREEIGVDVKVGRVWDALYHSYGEYEVIMLVYCCAIEANQSAKCLEVNDLAWCFPDELSSYDILAADRPLIARLARDGLPPPPGPGGGSNPLDRNP